MSLEQRADQALSVVSEWGSKGKLEFSIRKTEALMLKGTCHRERRSRIKLQDRPIRVQNSVKYLGVIWEEGL